MRSLIMKKGLTPMRGAMRLFIVSSFLTPVPSMIPSMSHSAEVRPSTRSNAPRKRQPAQTAAQVLTDPEIDPEFFRASGIEVLNDQKVVPGDQGDVPPSRLRDQILTAAGFSNSDFVGWDNLDKDFLFIRSRLRSLQDLKTLYPQFPLNKLQTLKQHASKAVW